MLCLFEKTDGTFDTLSRARATDFNHHPLHLALANIELKNTVVESITCSLNGFKRTPFRKTFENLSEFMLISAGVCTAILAGNTLLFFSAGFAHFLLAFMV